jgi:hypothetical protein
LTTSFKYPSQYFGAHWKQGSEASGNVMGVCGRVGIWETELDLPYTGHIIHLTKKVQEACRMASRFWLGDAEGVPEAQAVLVPDFMKGLIKRAAVEMAVIAFRLPRLYEEHRQ